MISEIVKALFVPGSLSFLVVGFTIGCLLLAARGPARQLGQATLVVLVLTYLMLSLPWVADRLLQELGVRPAPAQIDALTASASKAIVVVSGDHPWGGSWKRSACIAKRRPDG